MLTVEVVLGNMINRLVPEMRVKRSSAKRHRVSWGGRRLETPGTPDAPTAT